MLKIRLTRIGKKHEPHYRIVVIPARTKREGKAVEYLGYYNPRSKEIKLDKKRAEYWLSVGAQPSATVMGILAKHKLVKPLPRPDRPPKKPKKELKKLKEEAGEKKQEAKKDEKPAKKPSDKKPKQTPKEKKSKKEEGAKDAKNDKTGK